MNIYVCTTCAPETGFAEVLQARLPDLTVVPVDCMSGCTRPQTVAFRAPGKTAYLFGDITEEDSHELANFATLYEKSSDGTFADARVLGDLRTKAIARIPG